MILGIILTIYMLNMIVLIRSIYLHFFSNGSKKYYFRNVQYKLIKKYFNNWEHSLHYSFYNKLGVPDILWILKNYSCNLGYYFIQVVIEQLESTRRWCFQSKLSGRIKLYSFRISSTFRLWGRIWGTSWRIKKTKKKTYTCKIPN